MLAALLLLSGPAAAIAQTNAPPGNSAIDEYLETVPGATGNQTPRKAGPGGDSGGVLTAAQRKRLEQLGPDGKALAGVVEATSPAQAKLEPSTAEPSVAEGRSPLSQVLEAATGSSGEGGGMGILLPAILLASLLGCVTLAVLRRRSVS